MSLLSLIAVFLIEQFRPLHYRRFVAEPLGVWADFLEHHFNAGEYRHGVVAWALFVLVPVILVAVIYGLAWAMSPLAALVVNVVVLYLTMGFRQFSHHYTDIQNALQENDLARARQLLGEWRGYPAEHASLSEIARESIELALIRSHRHVFGVLLWFVLLPGPCGALLYRLASVARLHWCRRGDAAREAFAIFPAQAAAIIEWLPVRVTAAAFAIVGDFEDAVHCWRTQAERWPEHDLGIVLASGAGALGVQLGRPLVGGEDGNAESELGLGAPADADFMQSAVGLVWRATLLWMLLLFLLGLANMAG